MTRLQICSMQGVMRLAAVLFLVFFLLGMGGGDGDNSATGELPLPQKNYSAVITDLQGVTTRATRLTWEGKIYLKGKYGEALITVPFAKIRKVEFAPAKDTKINSIMATVRLSSDQTVELAMERTTKVYADTDFGQFEIFIKDLNKMEFNG